MKAVIFTLIALFSLSALANPAYTPVQREAVRFMIEDSQGHYDSSSFADFLKSSHLLTKKDMKNFPELVPHAGYSYVEIWVDDCVYDVAVVVIGPDGKAVNTLYIDFSERH